MLPNASLREPMVTYIQKLETITEEINEYPEHVMGQVVHKLSFEGAFQPNGSPIKKLNTLIEENLETFQIDVRHTFFAY